MTTRSAASTKMSASDSLLAGPVAAAPKPRVKRASQWVWAWIVGLAAAYFAVIVALAWNDWRMATTLALSSLFMAGLAWWSKRHDSRAGGED